MGEAVRHAFFFRFFAVAVHRKKTWHQCGMDFMYADSVWSVRSCVVGSVRGSKGRSGWFGNGSCPLACRPVKGRSGPWLKRKNGARVGAGLAFRIVILGLRHGFGLSFGADVGHLSFDANL